MELRTAERIMTGQERKKLKKSCWWLLIIIPAFVLFLLVAYSFPNLPIAMRIAAVTIPAVAILIFTQHHFKKLNDLASNKVIEYHGVIEKKVHFKRTHNTSRGKQTSATRYVILSGKKIYLNAKQFNVCKEGFKAIVIVAPRSQVILSIIL